MGNLLGVIAAGAVATGLLGCAGKSFSNLDDGLDGVTVEELAERVEDSLEGDIHLRMWVNFETYVFNPVGPDSRKVQKLEAESWMGGDRIRTHVKSDGLEYDLLKFYPSDDFVKVKERLVKSGVVEYWNRPLPSDDTDSRIYDGCPFGLIINPWNGEKDGSFDRIVELIRGGEITGMEEVRSRECFVVENIFEMKQDWPRYAADDFFRATSKFYITGRGELLRYSTEQFYTILDDSIFTEGIVVEPKPGDFVVPYFYGKRTRDIEAENNQNFWNFSKVWKIDKN